LQTSFSVDAEKGGIINSPTCYSASLFSNKTPNSVLIRVLYCIKSPHGILSKLFLAYRSFRVFMSQYPVNSAAYLVVIHSVGLKLSAIAFLLASAQSVTQKH
jgi:hypothetical protein